jgi:hypothetical protein
MGAYVLQFVSEKGKPVERPLFAKVWYDRRNGVGRSKSWKLADTAEGATQWKTLEAAQRVAAEFSRHPEFYEFAAIPAEMTPVFEKES